MLAAAADQQPLLQALRHRRAAIAALSRTLPPLVGEACNTATLQRAATAGLGSPLAGRQDSPFHAGGFRVVDVV